MANFKNAFDITMGHEGGYVNDPDDPGGETYRGISRRHHPSWDGWERIDSLKTKCKADPPIFEGSTDLKDVLKEDLPLDKLVEDFYKEQYWDRFDGDNIPDQDVAEELFDTAVNVGIHKAVIFFQGALNLLNRNQQSYPNVAEDGNLGPKTLQVLTTYLRSDSTAPHELLVIMNVLQGMHYITIMKRHPALEKYARGWLKRVTIGRR